MINRIDIITAPNVEDVLDQWKTVVASAVADKQAISARFLKVYRRVNKPGYDAISQVSFQTDRQAKALSKPLKSALGSAIAESPCLYTQINDGYGPDRDASNPGRMIIINPYSIPPEAGPANAKMWNDTKDMMLGVDGFVAANFYQTTTPDHDKYYFVSMAEWTSEEAFLAPFKGADYQKIVEEYQDKFQICFTKVAWEVDARAARKPEIAAT
ncbi:MAG: hypothetical protein AAFQ66_13790 [Pseudomonadota bacterium]